MTVDYKSVEVSFELNDTDLFEMMMHSKGRLFGLSGRAKVRIFRAAIAVAFAMLAYGLPSLMGMPDDDTAKMPLQLWLIFAGVIMFSLYPRYARWYTRRASAAYQTLPLPIKLVFDDSGIRADLDGQSGATAWKLIENAVETENYIFLYLNSLRAYIIPKSAIGGDVSLQFLRQLIAAHVISKA